MVTSYLLVAAILGGGLYLYRQHVNWPLWLHAVRLSLFTAFGALFIGIPALCGILLARYRVQGISDETASPRAVKSIVDGRGDLRAFLFIAGATVGLATLAIGALQRAIVPRFAPEGAFSQSVVLGYGGFLSGLLLILYVPSHLAILAAGRRVRDSAFGLSSMPDPMSEQFSTWLEGRRRLELLLEIDARPVQDIQDLLFILAPLLSSVLSLRFGSV